MQRWKHEQDLRMTHQEVRDEMKNVQGDPQLIARRRAIQRQMIMHRISTSVPKADVIVTNPTELSIAIQYDPQEMAAPVVVAKVPVCWLTHPSIGARKQHPRRRAQAASTIALQRSRHRQARAD